ncbi:MAG: LysM peptidoglycan-binding domain-containing protein [Anaerolineales bacterium]|nr:LysM peptidoglycan-binding domain-containing protein [Anaerolineales bacterium]
MDLKRIYRISAVLLIMVLIATTLSACDLPASQGPGSPTQDFPVPGDTQSGPFEENPTATTEAGQATQPPAQPTEQPLAATATPQPPEPQTPPEQPQAKPTYVEATPGIPATYTLQAGEFPFCIARRFDVDQYELLAINGLGLSSQVRPGTKLTIPQTGKHFIGETSLRDHPTTYTVKANDTIFTIACAFGDVSPDLIILQNQLDAPYTLKAGDTLVIP